MTLAELHEAWGLCSWRNGGYLCVLPEGHVGCHDPVSPAATVKGVFQRRLNELAKMREARDAAIAALEGVME